MRFYKPHTRFYCGVDMHSRIIYVCVIGEDKKIIVHKKINNQDTKQLLETLEPYKDSIVISCESTFAWYWLADFCNEHGFEFILGHPFYMKSIGKAKVKNDKVDSEKIARLTQAGMFPLAYAYPKQNRSLRDLLRRRLYFVEFRAKLLTHVKILNYQINEDTIGRISKITHKQFALLDRFEDESMRMSAEANLKLIVFYNKLIADLEFFIRAKAKEFNRKQFCLLQSIHGVGDIIALTILYEVGDINRFETVGQFSSYCRLVRCSHESAGKKYGSGGKKMGNPYLKRAFTDAALHVARFNPEIEKYFTKMQSKKGKMKAYCILGNKLARVVYHMLQTEKVFDMKRFLKGN